LIVGEMQLQFPPCHGTLAVVNLYNASNQQVQKEKASVFFGIFTLPVLFKSKCNLLLSILLQDWQPAVYYLVSANFLGYSGLSSKKVIPLLTVSVVCTFISL